MPRMDRGVAQRYAHAARKKKRRLDRLAPAAALQRTSGTAIAPSGEELEEALIDTSPSPAPVPARPTAAAPRAEGRRFVTTVARARATTRKPFSAYRDDYRYVARDLRRVVMVAGSLLLILIALSFVIR